MESVAMTTKYRSSTDQIKAIEAITSRSQSRKHNDKTDSSKG